MAASIAASSSFQAGRSLRSGAGRTAAVRRQGQKVSSLIAIFFLLLALPFFFFLGSVRLSPYRLVLIVTFLPCLISWVSGSLGRIRSPDILIFLAATWSAIVLVHLHGVEAALQPGGIFFIETLGAFLFARRYVRDIFAFRRMVQCLVLMVSFLLPFAVYENVTGSPILIELFGQIFPVPISPPKEPRWGFDRARATFEHPILFGVVCSSAFALSYYVLGMTRRLVGVLASGIVTVAVFSSLSAGALVSLAVQVILILWDKITTSMAKRWLILTTLAVVSYAIVESVSNRSAFQVFISFLTFNADQSYMRIHIWNYGTESVMRHPVFGVGLNEWEHPSWMAGSIDNFWLSNAVSYGIPGVLLIIGSFVSVCFGLGRLSNLSTQISQCRKGIIITLCGLAVAICTVHLWNASYVLLMFLLGSGMWMLEDRNGVAAATEGAKRSHLRRGTCRKGVLAR